MKTYQQRVSVALCASLLAIGLTGVGTAQAASCPSSNVGGKTIGWIEFDDVRVPLKRVDSPAGGELDPPPTAKAAGVTNQHQPLFATEGTTVIAWHVRYGQGCFGSLNPLLKKSKGATFDVVGVSGKRETYTLTRKTSVPRGDYRPAWFRSNGDPQIVLFTCSDPRDGKFQKTTAIFAQPEQRTLS